MFKAALLHAQHAMCTPNGESRRRRDVVECLRLRFRNFCRGKTPDAFMSGAEESTSCARCDGGSRAVRSGGTPCGLLRGPGTSLTSSSTVVPQRQGQEGPLSVLRRGQQLLLVEVRVRGWGWDRLGQWLGSGSGLVSCCVSAFSSEP